MASVNIPSYLGSSAIAGSANFDTLVAPGLSSSWAIIDRSAGGNFELVNTQQDVSAITFAKIQFDDRTIDVHHEEVFLQDAYHSFLNRSADSEGFKGWITLLLNGGTEGQVLIGIINSTEHQALIHHG